MGRTGIEMLQFYRGQHMGFNGCKRYNHACKSLNCSSGVQKYTYIM